MSVSNIYILQIGVDKIKSFTRFFAEHILYSGTQMYQQGVLEAVEVGEENLLPPATKLGQGYIFTGVCDSVHRGGVCSGGGRLPGGCLLQGGGLLPKGCLLLGSGVCSQGVCLVETAPRDGHCCGRYASYWNAFLFEKNCNYHFSLDRKSLKIVHLLDWSSIKVCPI